MPPKEMPPIRDAINRVTQSRRMLAHGLVPPHLGQAERDCMDLQAATRKADAWKAYTGAPPQGFEHGWCVDDEQISSPMLEKALGRAGAGAAACTRDGPSVRSRTTTIRAT